MSKIESETSLFKFTNCHRISRKFIALPISSNNDSTQIFSQSNIPYLQKYQPQSKISYTPSKEFDSISAKARLILQTSRKTSFSRSKLISIKMGKGKVDSKYSIKNMVMTCKHIKIEEKRIKDSKRYQKNQQLDAAAKIMGFKKVINPKNKYQSEANDLYNKYKAQRITKEALILNVKQMIQKVKLTRKNQKPVISPQNQSNISNYWASIQLHTNNNINPQSNSDKKTGLNKHSSSIFYKRKKYQRVVTQANQKLKSRVVIDQKERQFDILPWNSVNEISNKVKSDYNHSDIEEQHFELCHFSTPLK